MQLLPNLTPPFQQLQFGLANRGKRDGIIRISCQEGVKVQGSRLTVIPGVVDPPTWADLPFPRFDIHNPNQLITTAPSAVFCRSQ